MSERASWYVIVRLAVWVFGLGLLCGAGAVVGWLANVPSLVRVGEWGFALGFATWLTLVIVGTLVRRRPR